MPEFSDAFRGQLFDLMRWRRDVRRFRTDPVDENVLKTCLEAFALSPSVGLSEPWRLVRVVSDAARAQAIANFERCNAQALETYADDRASLYAKLKLSGMKEAPVHLAVFCDDRTDKGAGLGAASMPQARAYSVVGAIVQFWLALRAHDLGLGWVSILDPERLKADLDVPTGWTFVGYLCVGHAVAESEQPELEKAGWEARLGSVALEER